MSFSGALQKLKDILDADTDLQAYVAANFPRPLTVRFAYKNRAELSAADLPVVILTRPNVKKRFQTGVRDGDHTVLMYTVFQQDDRDLGPLQLIELEEKIDDAITADVTLGSTVISALPEASANDEGKNHPVYCMILSLDIQHRRFT